jgi:hypothetical protein
VIMAFATRDMYCASSLGGIDAMHIDAKDITAYKGLKQKMPVSDCLRQCLGISRHF